MQSVLTRYHLHTFAGQISSVYLMPNIVLRIDSVELFGGILFKKWHSIFDKKVKTNAEYSTVNIIYDGWCQILALLSGFNIILLNSLS